MNYEEIQKLGFLARIEVSKEEAEILAGDMNNILGFLKQIESVDVSGIVPKHQLSNIVREDIDPYEAGTFSESLLAEAPETLDGFIKVKKIL